MHLFMDDKSKFDCIYSSINENGNRFCLLTFSECIHSCEFNNDCKYCNAKFKKCNECDLKL